MGNENSTNPINKHVSGVKGWLLILVAHLTIIAPLAGFGWGAGYFLRAGHQHPMLVSVPAWSHVKLAVWALVIAAAIFHFVAGIRLWRIRAKSSVRFAKVALWFSVMTGIVHQFFLDPFLLHYSITFQYFINWVHGAWPSVSVVLMWTLYLNKSRRVENTYGY